MNDKPLNLGAIADLTTWVNAPTTLRALDATLDQLGYHELIFCVMGSDKTLARIAWSEIAIRRGLLQLNRTVVEINGTLQLNYTAPAFPLTKLPKFVSPS